MPFPVLRAVAEGFGIGKGVGYTVGRVGGDLLDLILIGFVVVFAVSGYRRGLVIGVLSLAGFVGGAALGLVIAPGIARSLVSGQAPQFVLAIAVVFVAAMIGQFAAAAVGGSMRDLVTWRSAAIADSAGGAAAGALSVLVVAWLVGTSVASAPFPVVVGQVDNSAVLRAVNRLMPPAAQTWFSGFRRALASGPFPQVFAGLAAEGMSIPSPHAAVLASGGVRVASESVVKVAGTTVCGDTIEGSGFVFAAHRVMTNAHVVAGVRGGPVVFDRSQQKWHAHVVLYDPETDIAVLDVPGLSLHRLKFARSPAHPGADAVVAGYPRNQRFTAVAARVGPTQEARGLDIYRSAEVTRQIYAIRAPVEPGDSGGPLLAPDGHVYGVVFAAVAGQRDTGYALTYTEVKHDVRAGMAATGEAFTQDCD